MEKGLNSRQSTNALRAILSPRLGAELSATRPEVTWACREGKGLNGSDVM